jgi:hypothetical protein
MLIKYEFLDGHTQELEIENGSDLYFFYLKSAKIKTDKPENIPKTLIISEKMFTEHEGSNFYRSHKYTGCQVSLEEIMEKDEDIPDRHDYYADSEFEQVRKYALNCGINDDLRFRTRLVTRFENYGKEYLLVISSYFFEAFSKKSKNDNILNVLFNKYFGKENF